MTKVDLTGDRYGKLVVLYEVEPEIKFEGGRKVTRRRWHCVCDCGNECDKKMVHLRSGKTRSCGCLGEENRRQHIDKMTTHHEHKTRLYGIWNGMKQRTTNPNRKKYEIYGGRNITMCDEWLNSYESFRDWALSAGYDDSLSIDRIDNNDGYYPDNCRWATAKEQSNNRRSNRIITANGESHTLSEWADITGINYTTISRMLKRGCNADDILIPVEVRHE